MSASVERIAQRLRGSRHDIEREVDEFRRAQRRLKQSVLTYIREGSLLSLLTAPIIYSLLLPLVILDIWTTVYQWVCFPIYGLSRVRRRDYFVIDRHKLAYLNAIEKVNCTFCSYANGLITYVREIAARTEHYWCPIKHARTVQRPHERYHAFFDYGDALGYRRDLATLRRTVDESAQITRMRRQHVGRDRRR